MSIDFEKLAAPFPVEDLDWRFLRSGVKDDKPWAMVVPYVTSRAIQERLDDVCGPDRWQTRFNPFQGGFVCELSILTDNGWITKSDGAELTEIEAVKGGISGALKRAAVQFGIGRCYYHLPDLWAVFNEKGRYRGKCENKWFNWDPPALPTGFAPESPHAEPVAQNAQQPQPDVDTMVDRMRTVILAHKAFDCLTPEEFNAATAALDTQDPERLRKGLKLLEPKVDEARAQAKAREKVPA